MADNHNLILLDSECEDICRVVEKTRLPLLTRHISGDLVVMCALEAMSGPTSSNERAKFTERLLARLHQFEASRSSKAEPSPYKGQVAGSSPAATTTDTPNDQAHRSAGEKATT